MFYREVIEISENRNVQQFSSIEDGNKKVEAIDAIISLSEKDIRSVYDQIVNLNNDQFFMYIIQLAIKIRPKNAEILLMLLSLFVVKNGFIDVIYYKMERLLASYGLYPIYETEKVESAMEILFNFKQGSIEEAILNDDSEKFLKLTLQPDFNPLKEIFFPKRSPFEHLTLLEPFTYMKLIAFFGSLKCFKVAISNENFSLEGINKIAIAGGSIEIIRNLQQKGVNFDNCFEFAIEYHQNEICDWLLKHYKCSVYSIDIALYNFNKRAYSFLTKNGYCKFSFLDPKNRHFDSYIYIYFIYLADFDIEEKDKYGKTILQIAESNDFVSLAKSLIKEAGADPERKNNEGQNSLHWACTKGYSQFIKYLVFNKGMNIEERDNRKRTPLMLAEMKQNDDLVRFLIESCGANPEQKNDKGMNSLHWACMRNNFNLVDYLIGTKKMNIEEEDNKGNTPLLVAEMNHHSELARYLIESCGANPEKKNDKGMNSLHWACMSNNFDLVNYLIEIKKMNIEEEDNKGRTPLLVAEGHYHNELAKYLVESCGAKQKTH